MRAFSAPFCAKVRDGWRYGECYLYCDVAVILPSECPSPLFWLGVASRRWLLESAGKVHNGGQETRNSRHGSMYLLCGIKSSLVGPGTFWGAISSSAWIARLEAHPRLCSVEVCLAPPSPSASYVLQKSSLGNHSF